MWKKKSQLSFNLKNGTHLNYENIYDIGIDWIKTRIIQNFW